MQYAQEIEKTFTDYRLVPREGQVAAINDILVGFLNEKMDTVLLSAPTGTGKSIIGLVTAETLTRLLHPSRSLHAANSSIMLCSTNVLSRQYETSFKPLIQGNFMMIKGAGNYDCSAVSTAAESQTADSCAWHTMIQNKVQFKTPLAAHCGRCEYLHIKQKKNDVRHLTTNYSYYFIDRLYVDAFKQRDLVIWDESHLVNDLFSEHNAIFFSQKRMQLMKEEIADTIQILDVDISRSISSIIKDCGKRGKINENNYKAYLRALQEIYAYAKDEGAQEAITALQASNMSRYSKLSRFTKKYEGLGCKIDDLFVHQYEHIFEYKDEEKAVSIKPIFVGDMMQKLRVSPYNLFMSATVSREFMIKTLSLDPLKTKFIKLPPSFPRQNKEIVFFDPLPLNYKSLQTPQILGKLRKNVAKIVHKHVHDGERGIILTPSFKLQSEIVDELSKQNWTDKFRLFSQNQGEKLENILAAFKAYAGGPAVLISPSLFEGVDLPQQLSRFQLLIKAPFPSLGDKRMSFILSRHPELYSIITIMKIIQGCGRSIRSADDFAKTYIFDTNAQRLLQSPQNVWKDEFMFKFSKIL